MQRILNMRFSLLKFRYTIHDCWCGYNVVQQLCILSYAVLVILHYPIDRAHGNQIFIHSFILWIWLSQIPHLGEIIHYLFYGYWLISVIIMSSRFIHMASYCQISFFFFLLRQGSTLLLYMHHFYIYTTLSLSIHLSLGIDVVSPSWLLGTVLAMKKGVLNISSRSWLKFFLICTQKWDYWIIYGGSLFNFFTTSYIVFHGCSIVHSHQRCASVPISSHPRQHLNFVFLIIAIKFF